eukprot:276957-Chlamydomonas_euryale.AAC.1
MAPNAPSAYGDECVRARAAGDVADGARGHTRWMQAPSAYGRGRRATWPMARAGMRGGCRRRVRTGAGGGRRGIRIKSVDDPAGAPHSSCVDHAVKCQAQTVAVNCRN